MPEPNGTRMQVVKGFSELNFDYVKPNLSPIYSFKDNKADKQLRKEITIHWPKWQDDRWKCWWKLEEEPLASMIVWPKGHVQLKLYADELVEYHEDFDLKPERPVYHLFTQAADNLGQYLIEHLVKATKL